MALPPPPRLAGLRKPEPSAALTSALLQLARDEDAAVRARAEDLQASLGALSRDDTAAWMGVYDTALALCGDVAAACEARLGSLQARRSELSAAPPRADDVSRRVDQAVGEARTLLREARQEWRDRIRRQQQHVARGIEQGPLAKLSVQVDVNPTERVLRPTDAWMEAFDRYLAEATETWRAEVAAGVHQRTGAHLVEILEPVSRVLGVPAIALERADYPLDPPRLAPVAERRAVPGVWTSLGRAARNQLMLATMVAGSLGAVLMVFGLGSSARGPALAVLLPLAMAGAVYGVLRERRAAGEMLSREGEPALRKELERVIGAELRRVAEELTQQAHKQLAAEELALKRWQRDVVQPRLGALQADAAAQAAAAIREREQVQLEAARAQTDLNRWHNQVLPQLQQRALELRAEAAA